MSSAGGSSAWNGPFVERTILASGECSPPAVTMTRAAPIPSSSKGTTKIRRWRRATEVNPWRLKLRRISSSASKRRPRTNQSSESATRSSTWSRNVPTRGAGTTTAPPSGSRRHTLVNPPPFQSWGSPPDVSRRDSTLATNAPCSGVVLPPTLGSSDGSAQNTSSGAPNRVSSTNSRSHSITGYSRTCDGGGIAPVGPRATATEVGSVPRR
mmetsp:Transcript_503/g.1877  ORF Transcript_503/g.1877 Transcript_503/m.1877 type:complete len:211 (-) Transcript_503:38-670(-)